MKKLPLLLFAAALTAPLAGLAEFSIDQKDDGIEIKIDGELFTKYVTESEANKPFFWPIIGPTGKELTRAYPMEDVEGERQDHPHHRSLWFGHQEINGFDTWHEPLTIEERAKGDPKKLAEGLKKLGSTVHVGVEKAEAGDDRAVLVTKSEYRNSSGEKMLEDRRTFTFSVADDGSRILDSEIVFIGTEDSVSLGDAKDSGFSVRVAHSMCVDAGEGGRIVNSEGHTDKEAWGQRAAWCDFNGPVKGEELGIAILNHPSSFRYPTPWHVRTYGLFTANPFGLKSVAKENEDGAVELKKGDTLTLRHRVIFHTGDEKDAKIAKKFEAYAKEKD